MNIEIVEFYPEKRDDTKQFLQGTLHVYLPDFDMDLRGVFVLKKRNFWKIAIPYKKAIDPETDKPVIYPIIAFANPQTCASFMTALREKGKRYILENFLNKPGSSV